jgi:alginate O-acetyltransferase complex protein AlgI
MVFQSLEFLLLLVLTLIVYYLWPKGRLYCLAIANAFFYGVGGLGYLVLFFLLALITYFSSLHLKGKRGKIFFLLALGLNLANLLFFKYSLFILNNLERFLGLSFGYQNSVLTRLVLPLGISFYTFQIIAYLVDIRRDRLAPCRSFLLFWVFLSFFALVSSGPIMRGEKLLPQLERVKEQPFNSRQFKSGLYLLGLGLSKKILFADLLSPRVAAYFSSAPYLNSYQAWLAAYLFTFQLYFDFSGYSDMALGIGRLFGLHLTRNFSSPYLSANPTDFWKRWHISLSSWIRDYIYIPLGGSKKGLSRQLIYLFIAMTVSGFWHGAAWTFIIWGMYHGILLIAHKLYLVMKKRFSFFPKGGRIYHLASVFIFFHLTVIGWVFFRAQGLTNALLILKKMLLVNHFSPSDFRPLGLGLVAFFYLLHLGEFWLRKNQEKFFQFWQQKLPAPLRALAYTLVLLVLILFTKGTESSFIYAQF